jgi:hypothetical protein
MKSNFYFMFLLCISSNLFGQLKVESNGKVIIGNSNATITPLCQIGGDILITWNSASGYKKLYIKTDNGSPGIDIGTNKDGIAFYLEGKYNQLYAAKYFKVSDSIIKFNHFSIQDPLAKLMMLKPYHYNTVTMEEDSTYTTISEYGFFSQEVESTLNEVNITENQHDLKLLDYDQIIPLLVAAVKEQQYQLDSLKEVIASCCAAEKSVSSTKPSTFSRQLKSEITQITPNPNNGNFQIEYYVIDPKSEVFFEIIDITGQHVKTLQQKSSESSKQRIEVNLNNVTSGQYLVRMLVNKQICDSKKILVN